METAMPEKTRRQRLEEMLADSPDDVFLRYGLAMEDVSAGDDRAAVPRFEDLLTVAPEYVPAYLQLGQALNRLGRGEEARDAFTRGIAAARQQGDQHAAEEMQGFLDGL
jgi:Tfp pilus assembly protein PilF